MTYKGRVQGGVIVLEPGVQLAEGAEVHIVPVHAATATENGGASTIGQKLAALGHSIEQAPCDLPVDLAANHDHYLHGLPKRK